MFGKIRKLIFSAIALLAIVVFSLANSPALAAEIEALHGIQVTEKYVTIVVTSTGCTKKEDFVVVSSKATPPAVTFIRLQPDPCRAAAHPYPIKFVLQEVGAKEFSIINTLDPSPSYY